MRPVLNVLARRIIPWTCEDVRVCGCEGVRVVETPGVAK